MPPSKPQTPKRQPLTLNQLASYDDILTDALVDHMYYWTTIPKNRPSYHPSRGVREEEISKIIQEEVVLKKDLDAAEKRLLATDGLRRFASALKTEKEKTDFKRHLRRYVQIYMPDCPFEVNATNRYTIVTFEAALTARRHIKRNEPIKYLSGIQVNITPEEEKEISVRKKDFSIVVSSRSKSTSLFMGPARFANHDCGANAKLMTTSNAGIEIIAVRAIEPGEEITVTYGDNYFGEDNCECLCKTCEDNLANGWAPEDGTTVVRPSIEEERPDTYSLRRRRRDDSLAGSSRTSSVNPEIRPKIRRLGRRDSRFELAADSSNAGSPAPNETPRGRKRPIDVLASPPITPAKKLKHSIEPIQMPVSRGSSASGSGTSSNDDPTETDVTSPEKESPDRVLETPQKSSLPTPQLSQVIVAPVSPQSSVDNASPRKDGMVDLSSESIPAIVNAPAAEAEQVAPITVSIETVDESQLPEQEETGQVRKKYQRRIFIKQSTPPARSRQTGDYVLTPLLLSEPESAWVQCMNCDTYFIQQNAYYTRSSCPRCERHSKVYGYVWPKTEKAGYGDKEERVLDHRTIHRFLDPDAERKARGRKSIHELKTDDVRSEPESQFPGGRKAKRDSKVIQREAKATVAPEEDTSGLRRSGRARRISDKVVA
ncbi:SET domain-containing protein [Sarocladium implicatum]|nr:SET domain-containing protein [Sarocladium implicatum]